MNRTRSCAIFFALAAYSTLVPEVAFAEIEEDWYTLPQPAIASFTVFPDGSAEGVTEDGTMFRQYPVSTDSGIRIQRFEIGTHSHYIVNGEIVRSLEELSLLLSPS